MRATVFDLPFRLRPEISGCRLVVMGFLFLSNAPDAALTTKAFASDDGRRLLDRQRIIVLPLLAAFVAQVPRM